MTKPAALPVRSASIDPAAILQNQPVPVVLIDADGAVLYVNAAGEQFFQASLTVMMRHGLDLLRKTIPELGDILGQACQKSETVYGHDLAIAQGRHADLGQNVDIHIRLLENSRDIYLVTIMTPYGAPRTDWPKAGAYTGKQTSGMAAVLAHEIKNPLSGIRGAAQLLERVCGDKEKNFTQLIKDEVDRICGLIDRMEGLSDSPGAADMGPVNIHRVLDHVKTLAQAGFASHIRIAENYDPSLPPVRGHKDRLIQLFLNIIKNAAEALEERGDTIRLSTAFRHDVRLIDADKKAFTGRAIEIAVADNGGGIPADLAGCLFDPFISSKPGGIGLGLAMAARIVADHGGTINAKNRETGAVFTILLPVYASAGVEGVRRE